MKVLHFTHKEDIDGMNCAVLGRIAFEDYEVIPTKTFEINQNVSKYIEDKSIYNYDLVLVTDLCIKEPVLSLIDKDDILKNKIIVLDHHQSEIVEGNNKYSFVNIIVEENGRKESGTSLFYKYLIENNYLNRTPFFDTLVEWTRQYDVWDWQKENNYNARKLHILFETQGLDKYMEIMNNKVDNLKKFSFDDQDIEIINKFEKDLHDAVLKAINNIKVIEMQIEDKTYKVGYTRIYYKYRNDINEVVMNDNKHDLDAVAMIIEDRDTISYRQAKKDCNVSKIATYFGGKGHFAAAGSPKDNIKFQELIKENNI